MNLSLKILTNRSLALIFIIGLFFVFPTFVLAEEMDVLVEATENSIEVENDSVVVLVEEEKEEILSELTIETESQSGTVLSNEEKEVIIETLAEEIENDPVVSLESNDLIEEIANEEKVLEEEIDTFPLDNVDNEKAQSSSRYYYYQEETELAISDEVKIGGGEHLEDSDQSLEYDFSTLSINGQDVEIVVSDELNFNTKNSNNSLVTVISDEYSFKTLSSGGPNPITETAISNEMSFTTTSGGGGTSTEIAISDEYSFKTLSSGGPNPTTEIAISDEMSFTTTSGGGPNPITETAISNEMSFTTTSGGGGTSTETTISDEMSFTTASGGGGGGGSSGGGGGGGRRSSSPSPEGPLSCQPYLKKFIRLGYDNDPFEVIKLKVFLNIFEGFNLPLTSVYDLETFHAVEIFQQRYGQDILGPWRINEPTGFVYITTSLKINYIVCGITAPIDLNLIAREDLIRFVPAVETIAPSDSEDNIIVPTPDGAVGIGDIEVNDFFAFIRTIFGQNVGDLFNWPNRLVAGLPFLSFNWWPTFLCDWCWLIILILLLIIAGLLYRNWYLKKEINNLEDKNLTAPDDLPIAPEISEDSAESVKEATILPGVATMPGQENNSEVIAEEIDEEAIDEYFSNDAIVYESEKTGDIDDLKSIAENKSSEKPNKKS